MLKKNGEFEKQIVIKKGNLYIGIPNIKVIGNSGRAKQIKGMVSIFNLAW